MRLTIILICVLFGCDNAVNSTDSSTPILDSDGPLQDLGPDVSLPSFDGSLSDSQVHPPDVRVHDLGLVDGSLLDVALADTAIVDPALPDAGPPPQSTPLITEFMARNDQVVADEDGEYPDWIELYNPGDTPYDLAGHHLTDSLETPDKWAFPAVTLAPRAYLVIFASGKDRTALNAPLHTGFRLSGGGETVALTDANNRVLHAIEDWPAQAPDVSYGMPMSTQRASVLDTGAPARLWIGEEPLGAEAIDFDDSSWIPITQGAGVDTRPPEQLAAALIHTDLSPFLGMANVFWLRIPVEAPPGLRGLEMELAFDDGLTVWADGQRVYRNNDSPVAQNRVESQVAGRVGIPLDTAPEMVVLRVVNSAADDGLFFGHLGIFTQETLIEPTSRYLSTPTPGGPNIEVSGGRPPLVVEVDKNQVLALGDPLNISAWILGLDAELASVMLTYRVMFGPEIQVEMALNEGRWRVELPPNLAQPGQMIRWAVEATDVDGHVARYPPHLDPIDSEAYVGTMVAVDIQSNLPIYHWFIEDEEAADTDAGTRAVLWYDGELYDNIYVNQHGQTTRIFPKTSYNFDFNRDHRFRIGPDLERVKDFDLLTNYADKAKMRNSISYGMYRDSGHASHLVFPVRIQRNGEFFAVYEFVEDPNERWLRRLGYEAPLGALYKCYDGLSNVDDSEKKTRKEEGNDDLAELIDNLSLEGPALRAYLYDHIDMARMANFLAMLFIVQDRDCCSKNYYAYHDLQTDQWWFMPWDLDLSLGRMWTGSYFDDQMYPEDPLFPGGYNDLTTALFDLPEFKQMYFRRIRTLADQLIQPPNTPYADRYLEAEIDRWQATLGEDAVLDNAAWGTWGVQQTVAEGVRILKEEWLAPRRAFIYGQLAQRDPPNIPLIEGGVGMARARWLVPTDDRLGQAWTESDFDDSGWAEGPLGLGYDEPGPYTPLIGTEVRPAEVNPEATTIMLRIRFQLDMPLGARLILQMKYDDGYVAWLNGVEVARAHVNQLSWRAEAELHDDRLAVSFEDVDITEFADALHMGENVLAIQVMNASAGSSDMLIHPSLVDGISGGSGPLPVPQAEAPDVVVEGRVVAGLESYVVIYNRDQVANDISGWQLRGQGIEYTFASGTVIPADSRLFAVANVPAFRERVDGAAGGQSRLMQGNWHGVLEDVGVLELAR